jgi:pyrroline-5-carboxylate reductase
MPSTPTGMIGFLGAGKMATALARGLTASGFASTHDLVASDVIEAARNTFADATHADVVDDNAAVVQQCRTVVLAVKPQSIVAVMEPLRSLWTKDHLLISVAAGTPLGRLGALTDNRCRLVRVMPNTPCLVGAGASAYALGPSATAGDGEYVQKLLSTVGIAMPVAEPLLDAVTGLSGSGPAYVFQMIEALSDGGVKMGLTRPVATKLAAQTLFGAAKMVLEMSEHPASLRDAVTSPGGTTIAGLHAMESAGVRAGLINAVEAATRRSQELGRG